MQLPLPDPGTNFDALPWKPTRVDGVSWIPLATDEGRTEGRARPGGAVLIRMEPGVGYTPHRHLGPEHVLVLQGGYRDHQGEHRRGASLHYAAGSAHAPIALREPAESPVACILYAVAPDGIELLEAGGDSSSSIPANG